jgi:TPR repeat protein
MCRHDTEISIDFVEAAKHCKHATDQGLSERQVPYAVCLQDGLGLTVNETEAAKYFKHAADAGDLSDALNYGLCLMNGQGVSVNTLEAVKYLRHSAKGRMCTVRFCLGFVLILELDVVWIKQNLQNYSE